MSTMDNSPSLSQSENGNTPRSPDECSTSTADSAHSMASVQMAHGLLQIYEPPLFKVRNHLKELIGKQNKVYIDLSAEKYKYENPEITNLQEMMGGVKAYREKLVKIKKQMQSIYQKSKDLKRRANNIHACKQKELVRKMQKQQQEEALIGKRNQTATTTTTPTDPSSSTSR